MRRPSAPRRPALVLLLALTAGPGCAVQDADSRSADAGATTGEPAVGVAPAHYGVPVDGLPTYQERLMLAAINRARADPNNVEAGTMDACSEHRDPQPPVLLDHDANQAADFHCRNLGLNGGGLSHNSYCELVDDLEISGCDGDAACACVAGTECWSCETLGGCGTGPEGRLARFGFAGSWAGEVGAAGYGDAWSAVIGWVTENPCSSSTLGHRNTVTTPGANVVGTGAYSQGSCWGTYHFADFGHIDGLAIPSLASGVHVPEQGGADTTFTFYAAYYQASGAPRAIDVVVDGDCHPMTLELGTDSNGTYQWQGQMSAPGCYGYYFVAVDPSGRRTTYPADGAYRLSAGEACDSDYTPQRGGGLCG